MIKKGKKLRELFIGFVILITILALIYTIFDLINIHKKPINLLEEPVINLEEDNLELLFSPDVDFKSLRKKYNNNDIIARLEMPNVFNILLTQTDNNDFYLNYNIKKERDIKGTEFIDYRNSLLDKQVNIYGHNSRYYDSTFKKLELFKEKEFFDTNEYILLQYSTVRRIYKIVAFKKVITDYEHMIIESDNPKEHIDKLLNNSIHIKDIEYSDDTNIIILQTCTTDRDKGYYLLIGFEI